MSELLQDVDGNWLVQAMCKVQAQSSPMGTGRAELDLKCMAALMDTCCLLHFFMSSFPLPGPDWSFLLPEHSLQGE